MLPKRIVYGRPRSFFCNSEHCYLAINKIFEMPGIRTPLKKSIVERIHSVSITCFAEPLQKLLSQLDTQTCILVRKRILRFFSRRIFSPLLFTFCKSKTFSSSSSVGGSSRLFPFLFVRSSFPTNHLFRLSDEVFNHIFFYDHWR